MYNAERPNDDELPSADQLRRSTLIAVLAAAVILVTIVLPAEYAVDPTGAGRILGLTEMGEIRNQLAEEADHDRIRHPSDTQSGLAGALFALLVGPAHAEAAWRDEVTFELTPGQGTEFKMTMAEGDTAEYRWTADGGRINYDLHGHGSGQRVDYEKGRGKTSDEGTITAPFAGGHGWFFRNRDRQNATVTLKVRGTYSQFKRTE